MISFFIYFKAFFFVLPSSNNNGENIEFFKNFSYFCSLVAFVENNKRERERIKFGAS